MRAPHPCVVSIPIFMVLEGLCSHTQNQAASNWPESIQPLKAVRLFVEILGNSHDPK